MVEKYMSPGLATYWKFLKEFLRHPSTIGAIAPSSTALARLIVSEIKPVSTSVIVEYGPGTGMFTAEILAKMRPGCRFIAIEKNLRMADIFKLRFPQVRLFLDSVENLPLILADEGISSVDYIISGLPWASFDSALQKKLMDVTVAALRPGGEFLTFAYIHGLMLPAGRRFRNLLHGYFPKLEHSSIVWRNLPPAFVYRCIK
jgi:phospholipid N-methyltransferase